MVFLSGWGLPARYWDHSVAEITAAGFRAVCYDRRGHGQSSVPGTGYDYDTLADDLAAVLESTDVHNATLVAYSMGGGEAVRYLTRHGSRRISRLVLVSALTPYLTQTADNPEGLPVQALAHMRQRAASNFPKWVEEGEDAYWLNYASSGMKEWGRMLMYQSSVPALVQCLQAMAETDFRHELKQLRTRTMVVHGDRDASAPLHITGQRTAALVPDAIFKVYEGAPHGLPITHQQALVRDLVEFSA